MLFGFSFSFLFFDFGSMAAWLLVLFWLWLLASFAFPVLLRQVAFWFLRLVAGSCGFWWR